MFWQHIVFCQFFERGFYSPAQEFTFQGLSIRERPSALFIRPYKRFRKTDFDWGGLRYATESCRFVGNASRKRYLPRFEGQASEASVVRQSSSSAKHRQGWGSVAPVGISLRNDICIHRYVSHCQQCGFCRQDRSKPHICWRANQQWRTSLRHHQ